jgi:hypothetical protein
MGHARRATVVGLGGAILWLAVSPAAAQLGPFARGAFGPSNTRFDLSDGLQVDEADAATRTNLERVKAMLADEQWSESVETLLQLMERQPDKLLAVSPRRFVSVREYGHLQIAGLPAEALMLYRSRVDPQARRWYESGMAGHPELLAQVVEQSFCSSWGDAALLTLGDVALERGDLGDARGYWKKILPASYWARLPPSDPTESTIAWLHYPDTDLDLAAVEARLLLAAILAGERELARGDLQRFARDYGEARGRLGGREVSYADFLNELLEESAGWPAEVATGDWPTFGGSPQRAKTLPRSVTVGRPRWQADLPKVPPADVEYSPARRVAESRERLLSYHPVIVGDMLLVNDLEKILAFDVHTGDPVWGDNHTIYPDVPGDARRLDAALGNRRSGSGIGAPRFTMTVHNERLYARMGNPVTSHPQNPPPRSARGYLVCLDLPRQASAVWTAEPDDASWAFEGSPVTDGTGVYVGMRRGGVRSQSYVACFDAEQGRLRWRQWVCSAESPAQGQFEEITHNLVTLHGGMLYYNTNLGAVAALDARDGRIKWLRRYDRVKHVDLGARAKHFYRDLTPCLYDRGLVYVAPSDSPDIYALDASTGRLKWRSPWPEDVVHLLGISDNRLVVSGEKLWWLDALDGRVRPPPGMPPGTACFPEQGSPKGLGRGILAGGKVYWPTAETIYVFDQVRNRQDEPINLAVRGASGGNLLIAGGGLVIVGSDRLVAFGP